MISKRWMTALVASVVLAGTCGTAMAQSYFNIGAQQWASDVTNSGVVVSYTTGGSYYTWTQADGLVSIGGVADSGQPAISSDGNLIGANGNNPNNNNLNEAAQYNRTSGTWTYLGSLGSSSGSSASSHWGMNEDGTISVGLGWINAGTAHAVRYNIGAGTTTDLGSTVAGRSSRANGVNSDGSVIVGWQDATTGFRQGAIWINGVQSVLLSNSFGELSEASAVTPDGQWVIGGSGGGSEEAWRYEVATGQFNYFGTLDPNTFNARRGATSISDDGSIVVGFERGFPPTPLGGRGYIWIEGQGTRDLTEYVTVDLGIDIGNRVLTTPLGISGDGTHIVGMSSDFTGFMVVIPEPASASLLALGAFGALLFGRRRS